MRLARYIDGGMETTGIVVGSRVVDLNHLDPGLPRDVRAVLEAGPAVWEQLQQAGEAAVGTPLESVRLRAPIAPSKFLAVGMNSDDHAREAETAIRTPEVLEILNAVKHLDVAFPSPRFPLVFNKQTSSIVGPHDAIWVPHDSEQIDYEGEVAVVIGRRVRRASEREAVAAIAGWTVTNDVTVRDWQWNTSQMWLGKSFETHGPIGPWIVTSDEFDVERAVIRTWVDDDLRQEGRLADQILSPAQIVSLVSQVCTLETGDLIATGTPGGVGTITGRYLAAGNRVRVSVSGIGEIVNDVVNEPMSTGAVA
jgi:2-keto-4-pentenoate hydratase/2-oxohepta-3-ene-1,7-dioic acid hydratase in catechol pathway